MASRLPVVISQSIRREPVAVNCEEQLITELLFTNGLDATLIGPLETIEIGSTDHLCLEGFKGPFALLGWTSIAECKQQLVRLGVHGSILDRDANTSASQTLDAANQKDSNRRVDYFRLRPDREPKSWIDSLQKILEIREVKAFPIQLPVKPVQGPSPGPTITKPDNNATTKPVTLSGAAERPVSRSQIFAKTIDPNEEDEAWEHLDELVEDLDRSDV